MGWGKWLVASSWKKASSAFNLVEYQVEVELGNRPDLKTNAPFITLMWGIFNSFAIWKNTPIHPSIIFFTSP